MFKIPDGRIAYFDCDDTLVMWDIPEGFPTDDLVNVNCRHYSDALAPNKYNVDLLKKFASSGHYVVVWSQGGADWAEAVVKALGLEGYVQAVMSKPNYFIDDLGDPNKWMGKWGYFDIDGNRHGHQVAFHSNKESENE